MGFFGKLFKRKNRNKVEHLFIYVDNDPGPLIGLNNTIRVVLSQINIGSVNSKNVALVMDREINLNTPDSVVLSKAEKHFKEIDWKYVNNRIVVIPFRSDEVVMEGKAVVQFTKRVRKKDLPIHKNISPEITPKAIDDRLHKTKAEEGPSNPGIKDFSVKKKICLGCNSTISDRGLKCEKCGCGRFIWQ